jgi:hypothetical protein
MWTVRSEAVELRPRLPIAALDQDSRPVPIWRIIILVFRRSISGNALMGLQGLVAITTGLLLSLPSLSYGQSMQEIAVPERCTLVGTDERCEASFGAGTIVMFGDADGVYRLVIDSPDTSVRPEKLLSFIGATWKLLSPSLSREELGDAFAKLLFIGAQKSNEQLRVGGWNWTAVWENKHMTLRAQRVGQEMKTHDASEDLPSIQPQNVPPRKGTEPAIDARDRIRGLY